MELFSHIFSQIEHCFFLARNLFCYRNQIENFPEWKTALNFPYDTNTTLRILHRNITLKYIFSIR